MKRLRKHQHLLHVLKKSSKPLQKAILKTADPDAIKALIEVCNNTLRGNLQLTANAQKKLCKYKNIIRKIASPSGTIASKRRIFVNQSGGFVGALITTLLSSIVGQLLSKYAGGS